ncbi:MAG TPA: ComEC/Rec2 family competence protein, partial [Bacteroidales bacterium]
MIPREFIRQAPFLRFVIPLMTGIGIRLQWDFPQSLVIFLFIITFLTAFCFTIFRTLSINYKLRWINGLAIGLSFICLGIIITTKHLECPVNSLTESNHPVEVIGVIDEPPEEKTKSVQCFLTIKLIKKSTQFENCKEKILLYLQKDSASKTLKAGDLLVLKTRLNRIRNSGNPFEFNYKQYLFFRGIQFSGYTGRLSWKLLANHQLNKLQTLAFSTREKLLSIFTRIGLKGDELGVASALIIGDKANLDDEIKQAYIASGTMHILAVSGMHIALLYWVLNILLSFLNALKHGKFIKLVLLLIAVWFYALITGLGGSILRAATMITFVIIGQSFNRNVNIFNSLAVSAFLLLLINPFNLVDVGFQLSYLAVISIVIFYPLIYNLIDIKNWLGDQLWSLTAVTLAAQLVTTPISLFYFHQFPNLFILSNLVMIPLSTLIMYFAMTLIAFSGWNWITMILGKVFNFLVWLLNKVVLTIESLPYALTKGIYINWIDVCLLYILVTFITLFLLKRKSFYLIASTVAILGLSTHSLIIKYNQSTSKEIIVYNNNENPVIQFREGNKSTWLIGNRTPQVNRYINNAKYTMGCAKNTVYNLDSIQQFTKDRGIMIESNLWIQ